MTLEEMIASLEDIRDACESNSMYYESKNRYLPALKWQNALKATEVALGIIKSERELQDEI